MATFGYVIVYVPDVDAALGFYEAAFGLPRKFLHESGQYGELDTGVTTLAFASHELGAANLPGGYAKLDPAAPPAGVELALVVDDVSAAMWKAEATGASRLREPTRKPWGQTVGYVRDPFGTLLELCTPMGA